MPRSLARLLPLLPAVAALTLILPATSSAQQRTGPWLGIGVGGTTRLHEADYSLVERVGPTGWVRGGLALESGHLVGVEWTRGWYSSPLTRVNRQSVLAVLHWPTGDDGEAHWRGGVGVGTGTVVRIEGGEGDPPGDRVVSIGEEGGVAASVGFSWRVPVRGRGAALAFSPGLELQVQRVAGETQAGITASVGLLAGRGFGRAGRSRPAGG